MSDTKPFDSAKACREDARAQVGKARQALHRAAHYLQSALYVEGSPDPDQEHKAVMAAIAALEQYPNA